MTEAGKKTDKSLDDCLNLPSSFPVEPWTSNKDTSNQERNKHLLRYLRGLCCNKTGKRTFTQEEIEDGLFHAGIINPDKMFGISEYLTKNRVLNGRKLQVSLSAYYKFIEKEKDAYAILASFEVAPSSAFYWTETVDTSISSNT
jgi:hypothetical protein